MKFLPLAFAISLLPAQAAVTMVNGGENHPSLLQNQTDWTVDMGVALPVFPASPGLVLMESGGDGTGVAAVLQGNDLVLYQDNGDFNVSTPDVDDYAVYDISSFSGQVVSMRLTGSFATATDTIALSILGSDGTTFAETLTMSADIVNAAGGNRFGLGGVAGDLAGVDESAEAGYPNTAAFNNADYDVDAAPVGANVLGPDRIKGIVYTGTDAAPAALPAPTSWGVVPEPSTGLLSLLGTCLLVFRRRR
ncbi:MAG: PEP-CTERM sorting domain-containing protein [Verrucomicrobiales bacterium]